MSSTRIAGATIPGRFYSLITRRLPLRVSAADESPAPLWHCSNRIQDRTHLGARRLEAARGVHDKIHPVALLVIRIRGIDLRDVIRGPERGAVGAVTRRGSVPVRRLPSPIPIPCKIPIPCFVSQFPIKSSQFCYTGNFAGKSLQLLTD